MKRWHILPLRARRFLHVHGYCNCPANRRLREPSPQERRLDAVERAIEERRRGTS